SEIDCCFSDCPPEQAKSRRWLFAQSLRLLQPFAFWDHFFRRRDLPVPPEACRYSLLLDQLDESPRGSKQKADLGLHAAASAAGKPLRRRFQDPHLKASMVQAMLRRGYIATLRRQR